MNLILIMQNHTTEENTIPIILIVIGLFFAISGLITINITIWKDIIRRLSFDWSVWPTTVMIYIFSFIFTLGGILSVILGLTKVKSNSKKTGMFSIFGSYGILLLSFIYAILFIYETRYTNGVIGYGIFSAISFVFLVSGGILIIKPLTVFSKGYVISQEKDKKVKHLIDYGSCTLFIFLSLIGTIINIIAICLHAQSGFTVGLSDIKILILGFVPLLGSILSVYSSYFSRKGKIIGVIIAFFSSWGNAVYVFGFFLLVYYNTPLRGAVMSNVWIYFLVLIFTQVNGLRILGSSEIYITPSARTESIS